MGVLGEAHGAFAITEQQAQQAITDARSHVISGIMANLSSVLAEPEYTGNVETALVHFMGERALTDTAATEPYTSLAERIKGQPDRAVPVIFVYQDRYDEDGQRDGAGQDSTAVTYVARSRGVKFISATSREEGVRIGLSGSTVEDPATGQRAWQPTTTTVTHSRLSLKGLTTTFDGDALRDDEIQLRNQRITDELVLQERHVADGNYGMPSAYRWTDYAIDRLDANSTVSTVLVGWEEIEGVLMEKFGSSTNTTLQEARKIQALFGTPVSPEMAVLEARAPRIAGAIKLAFDFEQSVGKLTAEA